MRRDALAVLVARDGMLGAGAAETAAEARDGALVVGTGAREAAATLPATTWWAELPGGIGPGALAAALAPVLADVGLVLLPGSPDGRDLAPRLACTLARPLVAGALRVSVTEAGAVAQVARLEDQVLIDVTVDGPAVATLVPGARSAPPTPVEAAWDSEPLALAFDGDHPPDAELLELLDPDPRTMDLADARRVLGGGAGLVPRGAGLAQATAIFGLLESVAAALGASAGATRVATDAGWMGHERQIGTTGVTIAPDLYIAFGVAGASQHTGGLGEPEHVVSVNTDAASPMTAMADLGLVTDARALLVALAHRLGVDVPQEVLGG
jgi:electron transfer flavoprotein alpha subunit